MAFGYFSVSVKNPDQNSIFSAAWKSTSRWWWRLKIIPSKFTRRSELVFCWFHCEKNYDENNFPWTLFCLKREQFFLFCFDFSFFYFVCAENRNFSTIERLQSKCVSWKQILFSFFVNRAKSIRASHIFYAWWQRAQSSEKKTCCAVTNSWFDERLQNCINSFCCFSHFDLMIVAAGAAQRIIIYNNNFFGRCCLALLTVVNLFRMSIMNTINTGFVCNRIAKIQR